MEPQSIKVDTTISITINGTTHVLNRQGAENLYICLSSALGKNNIQWYNPQYTTWGGAIDCTNTAGFSQSNLESTSISDDTDDTE